MKKTIRNIKDENVYPFVLLIVRVKVFTSYKAVMTKNH